MQNLRKFTSGIMMSSHDLILWLYLKTIPRKLFWHMLISTRLFRPYFLPEYRNPRILKINATIESDLIQRANNLNTRIESALLKEKLREWNNKYMSSHTEDLQSIHRFNPSCVFIIVPNGWLNQGSAEWHTQGGSIRFLVRGFEENGITCKLQEIDDVELEPIIGSSERYLVIIFSLSKTRLQKSSIQRLKELKNLRHNSSTQIIGFNSMSPSEKNLAFCLEWKGLLDSVIYFEENSDFVDILSEEFSVLHMPPLKFESLSNCSLENREYDVVVSSLIKFNRAAWLITLRALCIRLQASCYIRTVSDPLRKRFPLLFGYLPFVAISRIWRSGKAGLVLAHRSQGFDVNHLGTFWDFYSSGCIPIIQHEKSNLRFSSYLEHELDYLEVLDTESLAETILFVRNYPATVCKMRERIEKRMRDEFSPRVVVSKLLQDFSSVAANRKDNH